MAKKKAEEAPVAPVAEEVPAEKPSDLVDPKAAEAAQKEIEAARDERLKFVFHLAEVAEGLAQRFVPPVVPQGPISEAELRDLEATRLGIATKKIFDVLSDVAEVGEAS